MCLSVLHCVLLRGVSPPDPVSLFFPVVWLYSVFAFDHQIIFCCSSLKFQDTQSLVGSPSTRGAPHIIGAEDDDFGAEHEQVMALVIKY